MTGRPRARPSMRASTGLRRPDGTIRTVLDVAKMMRLRGVELRQFHDYARAHPHTGPGALAHGYWLHKRINELVPKWTLPELGELRASAWINR